MKKNVLGLTLGGGGAKGYFHVGVLTALHEKGIKFNAVSGTSIGSIVGALYALGYSPKDMCALIKEMGITKPSFMLKMKLKKIPLNKVIERVLGERSFLELKMPFIAVATNLDSGREENLSSGDLCMALSASSTIPPAYRYVNIEGKRLVDGGFTNSVPVNAVKKLGANKILAIDLSANIPYNYNSLKILDKVYPFHNVKRATRSSEKYLADVLIEPELYNYTMLSVNKFDELFEVGYDYAREKINDIKKKLNIP